MKTKKFPVKLALNKKTIADLNTGEMKDVYGGGGTLTGLQPTPYIPISTCRGDQCFCASDHDEPTVCAGFCGPTDSCYTIFGTCTLASPS